MAKEKAKNVEFSEDFKEKEKPNKVEFSDDLFDLLQPDHKFDLLVDTRLDGLPEKFVLLVVEQSAEGSNSGLHLLRYFLAKNPQGIFLSANKPATEVIEWLDSKKIKPKKLAIIDCFSRISGIKELSSENVFYADSPNDLIELSVSIDSAIGLFEGNFFVLIDSLSTMLVYNDERAVEKFVHTISGKIRSHNAKGIFLVDDNKKVVKVLSGFCDRTITL